MPNLKDQIYVDFSGGIVRNKSFYAIKKNELLSAYNVEIDELGRIKRRRGSVRFGTHSAYLVSGASSVDLGQTENGFVWTQFTASGASYIRMLFNNGASSGLVWEIVGSNLTTQATTSSTTLVMDSITAFAIPTSGSYTVEVNGDLATFTGTSGTTTLTGVSDIERTHSVGTAVHQCRRLTQPGTVFDFTQGGYYAVISDGTNPDSLFICARNNMSWLIPTAQDLSTNTQTTVLGLFLVNYRDRLYMAGSGAGTLAASAVYKVYYSALGNGTSWSTSNYFSVSTKAGDPISGLKVFNDTLLVFQNSSFFTYNQVSLKQRSDVVGAYNNKVIQEINGLIYTFCPLGIFVTNGLSSKKISDPIDDILKKFIPIKDSINRVVINTFAFKYKDNYCLYIHRINDIETSPMFGVMVCYDTKRKNWTIFRDLTVNINAILLGGFSFSKFLYGGSNIGASTVFQGKQELEGVFISDGNNTINRLFENVFASNTEGTRRGTDLSVDFLVNNTSSDISASFETPLYDLSTPQYIKKFKYIRGLSEVVGWHAEYRVENKEGVTGYKPIGQFQRPNQRLVIPDSPNGYRIGFRFSNNDRNSTGVFNGFIIEDTEVLPTKQ